MGEAGKICLLDIDVQGAETVHQKQCLKRARYIFVQPPSMAALEERLRGRGTETEEKIQKRLTNAKGEIEFSNSATFLDYVFMFHTVADDRIPEEVQELFRRLADWYPELDAPPL